MSDHQLSKQSVRAAFPVVPAFYRIADVIRITALSRATIYRRMTEGRFLRPVHLGGRYCGWTPEALQEWIDNPQEYVAVLPTPMTAESVRLRRNTHRLKLSRFRAGIFGHRSDTNRIGGQK